MYGLLSVQRSQPLCLADRVVMPLVLTGPHASSRAARCQPVFHWQCPAHPPIVQMHSLLAVRAAIDLRNAQSRILLSFYNTWKLDTCLFGLCVPPFSSVLLPMHRPAHCVLQCNRQQLSTTMRCPKKGVPHKTFPAAQASPPWAAMGQLGPAPPSSLHRPEAASSSLLRSSSAPEWTSASASLAPADPAAR